MKPPLKDRLRRGEVCTGTFLLFFFGGDAVQFFAGLGLDFLILDMEHSALDFARAASSFPAWRARRNAASWYAAGVSRPKASGG